MNDEPMTSGRLADELNALAFTLARLTIKARGLRIHLAPNPAFGVCVDQIRNSAYIAADLAAGVRIGSIAIAHADPDSPGSRPLLDAIESRSEPPSAEAQAEAEPAPRRRGRRPRAAGADPPAASAAEPRNGLVELPADQAGDWRSVSVAELELDQKDIRAMLEKLELRTLGELADYLKKDGFRELCFNKTASVRFHDARKVLAALSLWWIENRSGPVPVSEDNLADRIRNDLLIDWLRRRRVGDVDAACDRWSEFEVRLTDGRTVDVVYDPADTRLARGEAMVRLEFYGPLTSTGYRSHHARYSDLKSEPLVKVAQAIALEVHAETLKKEASQARFEKREAKKKAAETKPPAAETKPAAEARVEQLAETKPAAGDTTRTWEVFDSRHKLDVFDEGRPGKKLGEVPGANMTRAVLAAETAWPDVPKRSLELREKGARTRRPRTKPAAPTPPPAETNGETVEAAACNRCNEVRPLTVARCPQCQSPEYRIVVKQRWHAYDTSKRPHRALGEVEAFTDDFARSKAREQWPDVLPGHLDLVLVSDSNSAAPDPELAAARRAWEAADEQAQAELERRPAEPDPDPDPEPDGGIDVAAELGRTLDRHDQAEAERRERKRARDREYQERRRRSRQEAPA